MKLPAQLTLDDVIEIQPADPEKGFPRIQAGVVPGGVHVFVSYAKGDPTAEDILTEMIFLSKLTWEKLATMYDQRYPKQLKIPASLALAEEFLQRREELKELEAARQRGLSRFLQATMYGREDLTYLLHFLNNPPEPRLHGMVCEVIHKFISEGITLDIVQLLSLIIGPIGETGLLSMMQTTSGDTTYIKQHPMFAPIRPALYKLCTSKDPWRLKRCIECPKYFFDATMSGQQQHCSARCRSRRSSRDYYKKRREAQASLPS